MLLPLPLLLLLLFLLPLPLLLLLMFLLPLPLPLLLLLPLRLLLLLPPLLHLPLPHHPYPHTLRQGGGAHLGTMGAASRSWLLVLAATHASVPPTGQKPLQ